MLKVTGACLLRQNVRFGIRFASKIPDDTSEGKHDGSPSPLDTEKQQSQGWFSRILTGPQFNPEGIHKQSHSSMLSVSDAISHDVQGNKDEYLKRYGQYASELKSVIPGSQLVGSWYVVIGNQDQIVNLWRFDNYSEVDSYTHALLKNSSIKNISADIAKLCSRRRSVVTKPFSYWNEPKEREPSHIYDLRSYVLKPGSMIEWGNAWVNGITYRREHNQDVGGFFSQIGQLYMVFHIWAYKDLVDRNSIRKHTWSKPGWDDTVRYTVPLIKKMSSKILIPTELSKLK